MNFKLIFPFALLLFLETLAIPQGYDQEERRLGGNRRRPCVFKTKIKRGHNQGRTIFDWNFQHYDVSYNYNYNIDCSGGSGGGGSNVPGLLGSHFQGGSGPSYPGLNNQGGGGGGLLGSLFNRPQGGINNIPGIPQLGNGLSQSQSQSQTQAVYNDASSGNSGFLNPNRPILSGVGSLIGNIPHNPVAQGIGSIGEGIGSILQIIPQTVQSFTSSQSSSGGFFPQGIFSSFGNFFNRPSSSPSAPPPQNINPQVTTPSDPDDIIYNDETVTPINTNHDPVFPEAYNNVGAGRPRPRPGSYYNQNSNYNRLPYYSRYRGY